MKSVWGTVDLNGFSCDEEGVGPGDSKGSFRMWQHIMCLGFQWRHGVTHKTRCDSNGKEMWPWGKKRPLVCSHCAEQHHRRICFCSWVNPCSSMQKLLHKDLLKIIYPLPFCPSTDLHPLDGGPPKTVSKTDPIEVKSRSHEGCGR